MAPSATGKELDELPPVAAGGEVISRRTPAVVIKNTMSTNHRPTSDTLGAFSRRREDEMRFALFFNIVETLSDQVGAEPTEAGNMFPRAPSRSETISNAASQF